MKKLFAAILPALLGFLLMAPAQAGQQKPLTLKNGQIQQLQPGDTLDGSQVVNLPVANLPTGTAAVGIAPHAATNTMLSGMSSTLGRAVRDGYAAAGDVASISYVASASACSLNSGAGDGGSQIPTADGKCWIGVFPASGIDLKQFGAKCDSSTDDTTAIQRAASYAASIGGGIVNLPANGLCKVVSTITMGNGVGFKGQNTGQLNSGFIAGVNTINPMFNITANGSSIRDMVLAGINGMTGSMIRTQPGTGFANLENLYFYNICNAASLNGYQHRFTKTFIANPTGPACDAVVIGDSTIGAATTDILIDQVAVYALNPTNGAPRSCFHLLDAGGVFITHSDAALCFIGTWISPGTNQQFTWNTFHDTYLGDTVTGNGLVIDTLAPSAVVKGLSCTACWASSAASDGITISNTGGGVVTGIQFNGLRALANSNNGVTINAGTDITFNTAHFCGYNGTAIWLATGASDVTISNLVTGKSCMSTNPGTATNGIYFSGSNAAITVSNYKPNDTGNPIIGTPTGNSFVSNVTGVTNAFATVSSASTINLSAANDNWTVTGTTGVSTINGVWTGRRVRMVTTSGSVAFTTGGNICNAITSTQNVPLDGTYSGSCWYLK